MKHLITVLLLAIGLSSCTANAQQPKTNTTTVTKNTTTTKKEYFRCGATTKKGTPCQHIVKVKGQHCYQHQ